MTYLGVFLLVRCLFFPLLRLQRRRLSRAWRAVCFLLAPFAVTGAAASALLERRAGGSMLACGSTDLPLPVVSLGVGRSLGELRDGSWFGRA